MSKKIIQILLLIVICFLPFESSATIFNPDYIISDQEMQDYNSISLADIHYFLQIKGSTLAYKYFDDYNGITKMPAEIIYKAAWEHQISPKVILIMLQKEQSLIEGINPSQHNYDWATGYALCDSCSSKDPALQDFKGFGRQVDYLARILRKYFTYPELYGFQVGKTLEVDQTYLIIPQNQATANLYNYTPHYQGNYNFWKIWQDYWGKNYPDSSLLKVEDESTVWYLQRGFRRPIKSYSVLLSRFDPKKILTIPKSDLEKYSEGREIKFANYSLLSSPQGNVYLLVDDRLRGIASPEVFKILGFNWEEVIEVNWEEIKSYQEIEPITIKSIYPTGALLQNKNTGGVYYIKDGIKQPIYSKELMIANFKSRILTAVSPEELAKYSDGEPVKFNDGELIKSFNNPTVYVISEGLRRPITSAQVFENFGYKWNNIIETSQKAVAIHPLGEAI